MALSACRFASAGFFSMIALLMFGALFLCAQEIEDVPIRSSQKLLLGDEASEIKKLKLSGSNQNASAVFVVSNEEISFTAIAPASCLKKFDDNGVSRTKISYSNNDCQMQMSWRDANFYLKKYGLTQASDSFGHGKGDVPIVLSKNSATYGDLSQPDACAMNLKENDNPAIEGKYIVNFSISRDQESTDTTCDIELDFGAGYKRYTPRNPTEDPSTVNPASSNRILIIILPVAGCILLSVILLLVIYCVYEYKRKSKHQKIDDGAFTAVSVTPMVPSPKVLPMTKAVLSTTEVSWTFKTARPKDDLPPPKELFDKAVEYLEFKCRFKDTDTSEDRKRKVYAVLKKKQLWDYSIPEESTGAKKKKPSKEASEEKKTAIAKSQS